MKKNILRRSDRLDLLSPSEKNDPKLLVSALFSARGEDIEGAPNYALKDILAPSLLKGMAAAVALVHSAIEKGEHIFIVGDFDADGATSTAVLYQALKAFGAQQVSYLVPNRFEFGYGLTPEIVDLALLQSPDLIITVDNGISSIEGVERAREAGVKVLVTDHHLPGATLPNADAIVNPNQADCAFPSKNLAGVGVIFYVLLGLRAHLRNENWFELRGIAEPNMAVFLDLVALGTVADVVPLDFNNRILVAQGIKRIRSGVGCFGIQALLKVAGRDASRVSAADFGFAVGPRLNAAGRLDDMSIGIRCLLSSDWYEALEVASELDGLNQERRAIESSMQAEALTILAAVDEAQPEADASGICIYRSDWHQGVVGIVASRIKDRTHRPTIAFAQATETELKGSGRSIQGIHLRDVLDEIASKNPVLLKKFGGHAMAAGVSIELGAYDEFSRAFDEVVSRYLTCEMREPVVISDGELVPAQLNVAFAQAIRDAGPWGQMFPEPIFDGFFCIVDQRIVGSKHLKLVLSPVDASDVLIDAIAFNVDLDIWPNTQIKMIKLAYRLDINEFRGRVSPQLMVDYIEPA